MQRKLLNLILLIINFEKKFNYLAVQNAQFSFLISGTQRNFRNELFDSVEAQRN